MVHFVLELKMNEKKTTDDLFSTPLDNYLFAKLVRIRQSSPITSLQAVATLTGRYQNPPWNSARLKEYYGIREQINTINLIDSLIQHQISPLLIGLPKGSTVIELGTGKGQQYTGPMWDSASSIYAIEPNSDFVREGIVKGSLPIDKTQIISKYSPPYTEIHDGSSQLTISIDATHTIPYPQLEKIISELYKKLTTGGKLVSFSISDPHPGFLANMDQQTSIAILNKIKKRYNIGNPNSLVTLTSLALAIQEELEGSDLDTVTLNGTYQHAKFKSKQPQSPLIHIVDETVYNEYLPTIIERMCVSHNIGIEELFSSNNQGLMQLLLPLYRLECMTLIDPSLLKLNRFFYHLSQQVIQIAHMSALEKCANLEGFSVTSIKQKAIAFPPQRDGARQIMGSQIFIASNSSPLLTYWEFSARK